MSFFQCGRYRFSLGEGVKCPLVMGILNITPDSFSDGGRYLELGEAIRHAEQMIAEGVDIIDIGGESTRPGSLPVSVQEEIDRVVPVVEALKDCGKPLSIDTNKPQVMRAVLDAGADMINDICGFAVQGAMETVADSTCGLCIMREGDGEWPARQSAESTMLDGTWDCSTTTRRSSGSLPHRAGSDSRCSSTSVRRRMQRKGTSTNGAMPARTSFPTRWAAAFEPRP